MKVVLSHRFEAELDSLFLEGVQRFGQSVASSTFLKIDHALRHILASQPYLGRFFPGRKCYRYVVARTPFVIYYQIKGDRLIAVAIRHGAQDRTEFEAD
jgi:plasmid stabilization system protein ParE